MPIMFSARLEVMISCASLITSTPATPGSCGTENKYLADKGSNTSTELLHNIDVPGLRVDGGVIEACRTVVVRQFDMSGGLQDGWQNSVPFPWPGTRSFSRSLTGMSRRTPCFL